MSATDIRSLAKALVLITVVGAIVGVIATRIPSPEQQRLDRQSAVGEEASSLLIDINAQKGQLVALMRSDIKSYDVPIIARQVNTKATTYNHLVAIYNARKTGDEPDLAPVELINVEELERVRELAWKKTPDSIAVENLREELDHALIGKP